MDSTEQLISTFLNGEFGGKGVTVQVIDPSFYLKSIVEAASPTVTYVGYAAPGTATSSPLWTIKRITENPANTFTTEFAGGSNSFQFEWDDRAGLSYS